MRERPWRGAFDFRAIRLELTAVAWARDHPGVRFPLRNAAQMRTDGGHCIEACRRSYHVNQLVLKKCYGIDGIEIGISGPECRRRFEQDIRRKVLIRDSDRSQARDPERSERDFIQKVAPGCLVSRGNTGSFV